MSISETNRALAEKMRFLGPMRYNIASLIKIFTYSPRKAELIIDNHIINSKFAANSHTTLTQENVPGKVFKWQKRHLGKSGPKNNKTLFYNICLLV